mmetsp:Transcript_18293/g.56696  ORF Transcript_18293/g.56696 Transcript_18293/m.56696 type:complete len:427 (+) Transcript_18293:421-1701(+)
MPPSSSTAHLSMESLRSYMALKASTSSALEGSSTPISTVRLRLPCRSLRTNSTTFSCRRWPLADTAEGSASLTDRRKDALPPCIDSTTWQLSSSSKERAGSPKSLSTPSHTAIAASLAAAHGGGALPLPPDDLAPPGDLAPVVSHGASAGAAANAAGLLAEGGLRGVLAAAAAAASTGAAFSDPGCASAASPPPLAASPCGAALAPTTVTGIDAVSAAAPPPSAPVPRARVSSTLSPGCSESFSMICRPLAVIFMRGPPGVSSASSRKTSLSCCACTRTRSSLSSLRASCSGVSLHSATGVRRPAMTFSRSSGLAVSFRLKCRLRACPLYALFMEPCSMNSCDSISEAMARSLAAPPAAPLPPCACSACRKTSTIFLRCCASSMGAAFFAGAALPPLATLRSLLRSRAGLVRCACCNMDINSFCSL